MNAAEGGFRRNPGLLLEAVVLALQQELLLRFSPQRAIASAMKTRARRRGPDLTDTFLRAIRVCYRVLPFELTCLKCALAVCVYRRRRGLPAELKIGVQKDGEQFAAHAWVEDDRGRALTDPQTGFTPLRLEQASEPDRAIR